MTRSSWRERRSRLTRSLARLRKNRRGRTQDNDRAVGADRRAPGRLHGRRRARLKAPLIGLAVAGVGFPLAAGAPLAEAPRKTVRLETSASAKRALETRRRLVDRAVERFGIPRDMAEDIHDVAVAEGVDPSIGFGLVRTESSFRERVVSYAGARGLTQVLPTTARWVLDAPPQGGDALFERRTNLRAGFRYLRYLTERYDGDVRLALIAYNRGPATVERVMVQGADPDNGYADRVLGHSM